MKKTWAAMIAAVTLILGAVVVAQADIPDSQTGEITGCYGGTPPGSVENNLRLIDDEASEACADDESQVAWNQQGPAGISDYEVITATDAMIIPPEGIKTYTVNCPTGKMPLSGGYQGSVLLNVGSSYPNGNGWTFRIWNDGPIDESPNLYTVCASV